jgi:hypothetical protein
MSLATRAKLDEMRQLDHSLISTGYYGVGTSFTHPVICIWVTNTTDRELTGSLGGIKDHFVLPSLGYFIMDISANKSISPSFSLAVGERLYVKSETTAPTQGRVTLTVLYAFDN